VASEPALERDTVRVRRRDQEPERRGHLRAVAAREPSGERQHVALPLDGEEAQTRYRVTGDVRQGDAEAPAPLVVLHGGPGRAELPEAVQATLDRHEAAGSYDDPEYMEAGLVFYGRHVCRIPWPPAVTKTFEYLEQDPTVYRTMNGPNEFHIIGSCKGWQVEDRLHAIRVPTLMVSGRHDEATPALQQVLLGGIAGSKWVCFEKSSHMPHVEERERYVQVVGDWLAQHD